MNIIEKIQLHLAEHLRTLFSLVDFDFKTLELTLNTDPNKQQFGDLSTNIALLLAPKLNKKPREVAQIIMEELNYEYIAWIDIAGPGFINLFLTPQAVQVLAHELFVEKEQFFKSHLSRPQTYLIEFVSANPTGPLHLGHGRGGIIGDVLGNVLHFLGHVVIKEFYINDAGSQMQKLGESFKVRCLQQLGEEATLPEEGYQGEYLVELAQQCVKKYGKRKILEESNTFFITYAYQHLLKNIKKTLENYGINFDVWFSEKNLHENGAIETALKLLHDKGHIYEKEGAWWFASTAFGDDKDRVVKKSSGELTYVAADVAYLLNKLTRAQQLIMVLGQDHHSYVVRLKAVLQGLEYNPDTLDIILYQLVTLKESGQLVRMSKRAGRMVTLEDIIEAVGKDVARFFYLNRKADAHLDFDIDLALQHTDENPVYYIQYAYVRIGSILEKAQEITTLTNISADDTRFLTDNEKLLLKKIISLKHLLKIIGSTNQTHLLAYYVIELAHQFHRYYNDSRVIQSDAIEQSRGRLALMMILRSTFGLCFKLLGISSPEKM